MARITVEDCLRKVHNRFLLVNMVAKRVRQIREGSEYLVSAPKNEDIVISLREVAAGKIQLKNKDLVLFDLSSLDSALPAPVTEEMPEQDAEQIDE